MRPLTLLITLLLTAAPAWAQVDTLRAGGPSPTASWTLPSAYTSLLSPVDAGPLAFPSEEAAFVTRYGVRFEPQEAGGALEAVRLWIDGSGFGRVAQQNGTLREGEAPRFAWPMPFDHTPSLFSRQAVRFTGTGADLTGLRFGVGDGTQFGADDSLAISFLTSQFQVSALVGYAGEHLGEEVQADSFAVRFTAPSSGLLYGFDLDSVAVPTPLVSHDLHEVAEVLVMEPQTVPPEAVRYYQEGSVYTFALGVAGDAREGYGVRFTAPGEAGGTAAPLEAAEFYVFNVNDSRFFTGFDTPANDSLVVTAYAADADGLPAEALASTTVPFSDLRLSAFNRVDFGESGIEVAPGEDVVIGFETKVVDNNDIVSFISGAPAAEPPQRTLLETEEGWTTVFGSDFYATRADRGGEIRVRALFADPASGAPSTESQPLARGTLVYDGVTGSLPTPFRVVLDEGLDVRAGQEVWMVFVSPSMRFETYAPTSPRRFVLPDGAGGWLYEAGFTADARAVYGEGELPSDDPRVGETVIVALADLLPEVASGTAIAPGRRVGVGFADAPVATTEGEDYWIAFDVVDNTADDLEARIALVSGEPSGGDVNDSAAYVSFGVGGRPAWTFVQNTLFAQPYEFDVTAYYDAQADALDDDLVLGIQRQIGGETLAQMRVPLGQFADPNTDFAGFVDIPTFRLKYQVQPGEPFYLTMRLEPVGGMDVLTLGADVVDRPAGPGGSSFGFVGGSGWTGLPSGGFTSRLVAEALVNTGRVTSVAGGSELPETLTLSAYPSPLRSGSPLSLRLALPESALVDAAVYDVLGREVAVLAHGTAMAAGENSLAWTASVAPGVYLVRVQAAGTARTARVVVTQ
jgi:hypothetical protein